MKGKNKKSSASITVEASLCMPIFFFAVMALCYLFVFLRIEYVVQRGMYLTARNISQYGFVVKPAVQGINSVFDQLEGNITGQNDKEKDSFLTVIVSKLPVVEKLHLKEFAARSYDDIAVKKLTQEYLPDYVYKYLIDGERGLKFSGSVLIDKDDCIQIRCRYKLKLPFSMFGDTGINVSQNLTYRYFTGTEAKSLLKEVSNEPEKVDEENDEEIVLITETGYVYHNSYECPSLKIKPKLILFSSVSGLRNSSGGKYYPCEHCLKKNQEMIECYITPDGDRYHIKIDCPGLKRTIHEIPISQVGNRRECKRCKKKPEAS